MGKKKRKNLECFAIRRERNKSSARLNLVLSWPLMTGVPAFLVAFVGVKVPPLVSPRDSRRY